MQIQILRRKSRVGPAPEDWAPGGGDFAAVGLRLPRAGRVRAGRVRRGHDGRAQRERDDWSFSPGRKAPASLYRSAVARDENPESVSPAIP